MSKLSFNELKSKAATMGINTYKMKGVDIEAAIATVEDSKGQEETGTRGRPVNPDSARQKRLSLVGTLKRGRPVDPNSDWNKKQRELEAKRANGDLNRGRPVNPDSARQKRLAAKENV